MKLCFEDLIEEIYQEFGDSFQTAWEEHFGESNPFQSPYNRFSRQERLVDTLGFIACASVGRLCDAGLPFDFKELTDPQVRAAGQRLVLRLAEELLLCGKKMTEINELTACLRRLAAKLAALGVASRFCHGFLPFEPSELPE